MYPDEGSIFDVDIYAGKSSKENDSVIVGCTRI